MTRLDAANNLKGVKKMLPFKSSSSTGLRPRGWEVVRATSSSSKQENMPPLMPTMLSDIQTSRSDSQVDPTVPSFRGPVESMGSFQRVPFAPRNLPHHLFVPEVSPTYETCEDPTTSSAVIIVQSTPSTRQNPKRMPQPSLKMRPKSLESSRRLLLETCGLSNFSGIFEASPKTEMEGSTGRTESDATMPPSLLLPSLD